MRGPMVALAAQASGNADEARDQVQLARTSNPNSPTALAIEGHFLLFTGQPAEARRAFTACLRLDPRGPLSAWMTHLTAISYYLERDYPRSVEAARQTLAMNPNARTARRWLAAALGQLGRKEEARAALDKELELHPHCLNGRPVAARRFTDPRTTSTCWTACARRVGRAQAEQVNHP